MLNKVVSDCELTTKTKQYLFCGNQNHDYVYDYHPISIVNNNNNNSEMKVQLRTQRNGLFNQCHRHSIGTTLPIVYGPLPYS